jgi:acyl-coenzyme A thioesterase PaaI-like protein
MAESKNRLHNVLESIDFLPGSIKQGAASMIFSRAVPFVGTAGCTFEKVTNEEVIVSIENKRKARNHIGQLHAAAMALIAETASGFVLAMNMPGDKLNLIKSMKVEYLKRTKGKMTAVATISPEQVRILQSEPKGELLIDVKVTDESGEEPIRCEMLWAWVPKRN